MVAVGDVLPDLEMTFATAGDPDMTSVASYFGGKKVVVFAVPGAFTPTCHANHMPGFVEHGEAIKAKGVDTIACLSVNDVFVMKAWGEASGALGKVDMIADGSAAMVKALGMVLDLTDRGLGLRSKRFAMVVEDKVVKAVMVEDSPATAEASGAAAVLAAL